ncbi:hypothetical protein ILYODFUR_037750 [Ilyodon furcidens]|uniref:Uncharacterized protein n=1 Tax=Ilyodon furcidens TaxID=33524 RepID=A0ABV0V1F2_9TELE
MLQHGQYFLQPVAEEYADIYWGLLTTPSSPSSIFSVYQMWKTWIQSLCPYTSPPDPPHVTLFYDRCHTEWYQDLFNETVEGCISLAYLGSTVSAQKISSGRHQRHH